jgi:twinkle protein
MLQVVPGELTIVTGLSNSGKSEWLDALTVNLAQHHHWRIAVCSLENTPVEHGRKLMEKYLGKQQRCAQCWQTQLAVCPGKA